MNHSRSLVFGLTASLSLLVLNACGADKTKNTASELQGLADSGETQAFNLARFIRENKNTTALKGFVTRGDANVGFGDKKKFRVETNFTVNADGRTSLPLVKRNTSANIWLDSFIFNKKIGSAKGYILDMGANASLDSSQMEAYLRFLGEDKYRGHVSGVYEQAFTRDLNRDAIVYPVPMLGVKLGGNIGGELGLRAQLGVNNAEMITLAIRPRAALHAGVAAGIEVLKFAEARVEGMVKVIDMQIATSASIGYIPASRFTYGNIGVDAATITAADGKVEILAKATVPGFLPGGVDKKLWTKLLSAVGLNTEWEWRHTVWDPQPGFVKDIPGFGTSFYKFMDKDCRSKTGPVRDALNRHRDALNQHKGTVSGLDALVDQTSMDHLNGISDKVAKTCG
jgi:hypothetical protein